MRNEIASEQPAGAWGDRYVDDCCHMTQVSPGLGVYTSLGVIIPVLSDCGLQTIEILFTFHSHTFPYFSI